MKKILLGLFVSFISLIGFGNCATNCLSPGDVISSQQDDYYTNCDYNQNLIFCVMGQQGMFYFPNGWQVNLQGFPICSYVSRNQSIQVLSWGGVYQVSAYNTLSTACDGSDFKINFVDSYTNNISENLFHLDDGDYFQYSIYYNSNNTPITIKSSQAIVNLASRYDNIQCESHIQFQDISNGTGVKTLSSYFNPFSGANNNSVYYDSQENVIQIDNQYGVAEVISSIPITPPTPCDCSQAISGAVSQCESQLSSMSGNYNSCLSELNSCMSNSGTNCSGTGSNWSALFINNIQHLGKPIINITIPEEINWDYNSTGDLFDLSVVGYNVDYEKIEGIIDIQNIKPTKEDFNKLVSEVVPLLIPGLFIIAFIYFVFRFIKKIF